eukprot:g3954.t1
MHLATPKDTTDTMAHLSVNSTACSWYSRQMVVGCDLIRLPGTLNIIDNELSMTCARIQYQGTANGHGLALERELHALRIREARRPAVHESKRIRH